MKKKILFILLAATVTASVFAQGWGREWGHPRMPPDRGPRQMMPRGNPGYGGPQRMMPEGRGNIPRPATEAVSISGNLIVAHGRPALKSGDVTYLVLGLNRLTGFVDGLKEGAMVAIEGTALSRQKDDNVKFLAPAKLTLGGKTYDMAFPEEGMRNNHPGNRGRREDHQERNNPYGKQRWNYL